MNDTTRVGDRVETLKSRRTGCVQGIYGDKAWILLDSGELETLYLSVLTRIEPEKVTLTPKYSVGQRLNCIGQGKVQVTGPEVGYHVVGWSGLWPESLFESLSEPCDKCGK